MALVSRLAAAASGDTTAVVFSDNSGGVDFLQWKLGEGASPYSGLGNLNGRPVTEPAAALVGPGHDYLFAVVRDGQGALHLTQGSFYGAFTDWDPMNFESNAAPAAAASGESVTVVAVSLSGRVCYTYWDLGQAASPFFELGSPGPIDGGAAAALVGHDHDYLFVAVKDTGGQLFLNQGHLGGAFVGWEPFKPNPGRVVSVVAASSGDMTAVITVDPANQMRYSYWRLGEAASVFYDLGQAVVTDAPPAAALVGAGHDYLFVLAEDSQGNVYVDQGHLGREFVGWQALNVVGYG